MGGVPGKAMAWDPDGWRPRQSGTYKLCLLGLKANMSPSVTENWREKSSKPLNF